MSRLLRALTAFMILPGTVALLVPWWLRPADARMHVVGVPVLGAGAVLLLWCVRDFHVSGRGSLAPWDPPARLVRVGLYRRSRNPMYLAVLLMLAGWALVFQARAHGIYLAAVAIAFHLRVVRGEEPWLERTHGDAWRAYSATVPRWLWPPARTSMPDLTERTPRTRWLVPPLVLLAGAIAISTGLAAVDPVARPSPPLRVVGTVLALAGLALALVGVVAFRRQRTTIDPRYPERATALVSAGVYAWTRNPMYLGFVVVAIGAAAWLGSALALVGPLALAAWLDRVQIPAEERALEAHFGAAFTSYARVVRRWLGRRAA